MNMSCKKDYPFYYGDGMIPIYISKDSLTDIRNLPPQPIEKTGSIFWYGSYFLMIEEMKGIHVFEVKDSVQPIPLTFLKIPAVSSFTIQNDVLFADNATNLVAIDVSNIQNIVLLSVSEDVYTQQPFPPLYNGHFVCYDKSKGYLGGWKAAEVNNAACRTFN
jgi:hypothetical protein